LTRADTHIVAPTIQIRDDSGRRYVPSIWLGTAITLNVALAFLLLTVTAIACRGGVPPRAAPTRS
jgi:hypothetical protein